MGSIITIVAMALIALIGLPIRTSRKLNTWWRQHWWVPIVIGSIAFVLMALSITPFFQTPVYEAEFEAYLQTPCPYLLIPGWLLTIFAALHFYPPETLR